MSLVSFLLNFRQALVIFASNIYVVKY